MTRGQVHTCRAFEGRQLSAAICRGRGARGVAAADGVQLRLGQPLQIRQQQRAGHLGGARRHRGHLREGAAAWQGGVPESFTVPSMLHLRGVHLIGPWKRAAL